MANPFYKITTKKFSDEWMVVDQEIVSELGDELRKAIDDEILHTITGPKLFDDGWTQVVLNGWYEITNEWLNDNISGKFKCFGYYWYFENKEDAVLFAVRWS